MNFIRSVFFTQYVSYSLLEMLHLSLVCIHLTYIHNCNEKGHNKADVFIMKVIKTIGSVGQDWIVWNEYYYVRKSAMSALIIKSIYSNLRAFRYPVSIYPYHSILSLHRPINPLSSIPIFVLAVNLHSFATHGHTESRCSLFTSAIKVWDLSIIYFILWSVIASLREIPAKL